MQKTKRTNGYSLVEVMVAIAVLMVSIVGPMTIASKSTQSAQHVLQQNTAFFLAQEGITAFDVIRNEAEQAHFADDSVDSWDWVSDSRLASCFSSNGCNIDFTDDTLLNNVTSCVGDACKLYFSATYTRAAFHAGSGDETPFTRVIKLTSLNGHEVQVKSTVTWKSHLLGEDNTVTLTTSLFNIYGND